MVKHSFRFRILLVLFWLPFATLLWESAFAASSCRELFSEPISEPRIALAKELEPLSTNAVFQLHSKIRSDWGHPYTLIFDLKQEIIARGGDPDAKVQELITHFIQGNDSNELAKRLGNWIDSETQALIVADVLMQLGLSRHREVIEHLYTHNVFFSDAHPIRGPPDGSGLAKGLVTFSFEKEGFNASITDFYRDPGVSENRWHSEPIDLRLEALQKLKVPKKQFLSPLQVAPTNKKPSFLGGFSVELSDSSRKGWSWEISHKKFEMSRFRIMQQVRSISNHFKETHSFHFHIVFELPKSYSKFPRFIRWHKHVNDYLYLRGLEEGLHGNYLTNIVNDRRDLSLLDQVRSWLKPLRPSQVVPNKLSQIDKYGAKFFTVGLRGGSLYGTPAMPENVKLGLELRDVTRNLDSLDQYTKNLTDAVTEYRWEMLNEENSISSGTPRLNTVVSKARSSLSAVVGEKWAKYFHEVESTAALPLIAFESGSYFNYRSGKFESPSREVVARLQAARAVYEKSLRNLINEINSMQMRSEKVSPEEVRIAIRMSMSEWAGLAKASELYSNY